jgi:hypothetical protein
MRGETRKRSVLVFSVLCAWGCAKEPPREPTAAPSTAPAAPAAPKVDVPLDLPVQAQSTGSEERESPPERKVLRGKLQLTKGAQGMLDGYLVPPEEIEKHAGESWRDTWVGRSVRVEAQTRVHSCGPQEQCLIGGSIPYVTELLSWEAELAGERCPEALRVSQPCKVADDYCVVDMGKPCGASTTLHCVDGAWRLTEEKNLCD